MLDPDEWCRVWGSGVAGVEICSANEKKLMEALSRAGLEGCLNFYTLGRVGASPSMPRPFSRPRVQVSSPATALSLVPSDGCDVNLSDNNVIVSLVILISLILYICAFQAPIASSIRHGRRGASIRYRGHDSAKTSRVVSNWCCRSGYTVAQIWSLVRYCDDDVISWSVC